MKHFKLKDYIISILIISVTILYFIDEYIIPEGVKTISILGFEIGSFGFSDILHLIFYAKMKLLILFFSITWYLTCRHWWKPAILVLIILELFKLATVFNYNNNSLDEVEFITSLPITIPFIILLLLYSLKIKHFRLSKEVRLLLDDEIDDVFFSLKNDKLNQLNDLKTKIANAKKMNYKENKELYIKELTLIRNKFYNL